MNAHTPVGSLAVEPVLRVDGSVGPEEALTLLGDLGFALVTDAAHDGLPVALLSRSDLTALRDRRAATLCPSDAPARPAVLVPAGLTLGELVGGAAVTLLALSPHGAVVVDPSGGVTVLPGSIVDDFLDHGALLPAETRGAFDMSATDSVLAGEVSLPFALVACAAPGCGHVNHLGFFDPQRPPVCAHPGLPPHTLTITRG
ncbi:hypothetical protein [Streptomyces avidinii]|uniref:CBS domain-containing protein n=1 Tax=Streptomyces avidinii TaxID=1895 RepID=A0ABS4KZ39_STRAV|nr:hypothetical protein [Streptomyces avidinii]MBP2035299.1 hypothetical protein [Streptomyces avidinii]